MSIFKFSIGVIEKEPEGLLKDGSSFNPTIVIGDLLYEMKCGDALKYLKNTFQIDTIEDEIEFEYFLQEVHKFINSEKTYNFLNFEIFRIFYELKFDIIVARPKKGFEKKAFFPSTWQFDKFSNIMDEIDKNENIYIYTCRSYRDIIFAIIHYLLLHNYKFRLCEHCQKYFAVKSLKIKYCSRNSPMRDRLDKDYPCAIAVDHIMKTIKKRKHSVENRLRIYYPQALNEFYKKYNEVERFEGQVLPRSVGQLNMLLTITEKEYVRQHWYKEEYK